MGCGCLSGVVVVVADLLRCWLVKCGCEDGVAIFVADLLRSWLVLRLLSTSPLLIL